MFHALLGSGAEVLLIHTRVDKSLKTKTKETECISTISKR